MVRNRLQPASTVVLPDVVASGRSGLLAIALDPRFERNGLLYSLYTGASGFRIVRFRSTGDTLGDGAILSDGIAFEAARPAASLRFGPDAKLYVAFVDAGDGSGTGDVESVHGRILRLNADGSAPEGRLGDTAVYASQIASPRGMDWDTNGTLWVVEEASNGQDRLQAVVEDTSGEQGGMTIARYVLPADTGPAGVAFYRGNAIDAFRGDLLVAADSGRAVLRLRLDSANPGTIVSTERLLGNTIGRIRAIGAAPWGTVYLCTETAVVQVVPDAPPSRARRLRTPSDQR